MKQIYITIFFAVSLNTAALAQQVQNIKKTAGQAQTTVIKKVKQLSEFEDETNFCVPNTRQGSRPFYRSKLDGAVCCKGNIIQAAAILPEWDGECAVTAKTDEFGIFHPSPLWCSYTCSLKKLGLMDREGNIKPLEFFNHLARVLGPNTKESVRKIMADHLKCMSPFKNPKYPCFTPLGFHKCYVDALEFLCTKGFPADGDFTKVPNPNFDYVNLQPSCRTGERQVMPACCHGRPLPWTIPDIVEAPRNKTKMKTCMMNMQNRVCAATCFLNSAGVVDDSMELDVQKFENSILRLFPMVKPSIWMNFLGPTYVFFDETLEEMSANLPTAARVCLFHDKILNFHEDKIQQYCEMTPPEIKQIMSQK